MAASLVWLLALLLVGTRAHADLLVRVDNEVALTSVARYDEVSGAFLGAFAQGAGTGLTFGRQGLLYVSDEANGRVLRFHGRTGAFLGVFAFGIDTARNVTFGPDGNLYVTSTFTDEVIRYNGKTDALIGTFASGGGLSLPYGLVFGPDGNLYVTSGSNEVIRFNGTTGALIGTFASGPELNFPSGLTFTPRIPPKTPPLPVRIRLPLFALVSLALFRGDTREAAIRPNKHSTTGRPFPSVDFDLLLFRHIERAR